MPKFQQDVKVVTCHKVFVEAESAEEASEIIDSMNLGEIKSFPKSWEESDFGDEMAQEVPKPRVFRP